MGLELAIGFRFRFGVGTENSVISTLFSYMVTKSNAVRRSVQMHNIFDVLVRRHYRATGGKYIMRNA